MKFMNISKPARGGIPFAQTASRRNSFAEWLARITLALLVFKISRAGYYISDAYGFYLEHGYIQTDDIVDEGGQLSFIGTVATASMICLIVFGFASGRGARFFSSMRAVILVHAYIFVSSFWSNIPVLTFFELIKSGVSILALFFALDILGGRRALEVSLAITGLIAGASFVLSVLDPAFQISLGAEGWRGLFAHKNWLAAFCMFSITVILPSCFRKRVPLVEASLLGLLMTLLLLSEGKTALALTVFYVFTLLVGVYTGRNVRKSIISFIYFAIFPAIALIAIAFPIIAETEILSFSGRSYLWKYFYSELYDNFIFGYGGYTLKSDPDFAKHALNAIGLPGPDSSVVVMTVNYGVIYPFLQAAFLWPFISALRGRDDLYSLALSAALFVSIGYGCMESDAGLSANLSFISIAIIAAQIPAARLDSQARKNPFLRQTRFRRLGEDMVASPDTSLRLSGATSREET